LQITQGFILSALEKKNFKEILYRIDNLKILGDYMIENTAISAEIKSAVGLV
jgi:hypothetical protein